MSFGPDRRLVLATILIVGLTLGCIRRPPPPPGLEEGPGREARRLALAQPRRPAWRCRRARRSSAAAPPRLSKPTVQAIGGSAIVIVPTPNFATEPDAGPGPAGASRLPPDAAGGEHPPGGRDALAHPDGDPRRRGWRGAAGGAGATGGAGGSGAVRGGAAGRPRAAARRRCGSSRGWRWRWWRRVEAPPSSDDPPGPDRDAARTHQPAAAAADRLPRRRRGEVAADGPSAQNVKSPRPAPIARLWRGASASHSV